MTEQYNKVPSELKNLKQWVCYQLENKGGQIKKIPKNPHTGKSAKSNDVTTWGSYADAVTAVQKYKFDGIGIMFDNGICGIDIDHCVNDGALSPLAADIVGMMDSYTEFSPSGTGIHILFTGSIDEAAEFYTKNPNNGIEIYTHGRYFTVTGNALKSADNFGNRTENVKSVQDKYMRRQTPASNGEAKPATAAPGPILTDDEIIRKAEISRKGAEFKKLWGGDWSGYTSQSDADLALCNMLAFYTGRDAATIDRLFRQSRLIRPKWDEDHGGKTYGNRTIQKAIDTCRQVYNPARDVYFEENGCLYRRAGQNKKYLANFTAYPIEDVIKDNGVETSRYFVIGGNLATGETLPKLTIAAAEFSSMKWVTSYWGLRANFAPGNINKDYVRDYIQSQAVNTDVVNSVIYTHTGFREIDGNLCYLYNGGAIGADNISCELEGGLADYTFIKNTQGISEAGG